MKIFVVLVIYLNSVSSTWLGEGTIDAVFYNSMPKLYKMDNFEECSESAEPMPFPKQYCIINVNVVRRDNEKTLKGIKTFSQTKKFHFNHLALKHGVCFSNCLAMHTSLKDNFKDYLNDKTVMSQAPIAEGRKIMLNKLANVCINKELIDYYGVMAETSIDYCVYDDLTHDNYNKLFYIFVFGSVFMFSIAAVYETYKDRTRVAAALASWKRVRRYLSAFSIRRNWQALIVGDNVRNLELDNELHLARLCGIKVLLLFLFVLSQVYRQLAAMPFANPIYIEKHINRFCYNIFNEGSVVHLFFTVSGISSAFFITTRIDAFKVRFYNYFLDVFNIIQDQTFALSAFFALLTATVLPHLSSAPFWRHVTLSDMENCRNNWKFNVLLTHNYAKQEKMCLEPTWIFAAELHLMLIAVAVLLLAVKFPKYAKFVFGSSLLASFSVIAYRIYSKKLTPYAIITPEMLRNNHLTSNNKFHEVFYSSHMNAGNFLIGLIFGYLLHTKSTLLQRLRSKTLTVVSILSYFLLPPALKLVLQLNYIKSTIATALLGAYMKHDGLQLSLILLNLVFAKDDNNNGFARFFTIFKFLDKLFMPAFFTQIIVTKVFLGNTGSLIEMSAVNVFSYSCAIFIVSYIASIFTQVLIQAPIMVSRIKQTEAERANDVSEEEKVKAQ